MNDIFSTTCFGIENELAAFDMKMKQSNPGNFDESSEDEGGDHPTGRPVLAMG